MISRTTWGWVAMMGSTMGLVGSQGVRGRRGAGRGSRSRRRSDRTKDRPGTMTSMMISEEATKMKTTTSNPSLTINPRRKNLANPVSNPKTNDQPGTMISTTTSGASILKTTTTPSTKKGPNPSPPGPDSVRKITDRTKDRPGTMTSMMISEEATKMRRTTPSIKGTNRQGKTFARPRREKRKRSPGGTNKSSSKGVGTSQLVRSTADLRAGDQGANRGRDTSSSHPTPTGSSRNLIIPSLSQVVRGTMIPVTPLVRTEAWTSAIRILTKS